MWKYDVNITKVIHIPTCWGSLMTMWKHGWTFFLIDGVFKVHTTSFPARQFFSKLRVCKHILFLIFLFSSWSAGIQRNSAETGLSLELFSSQRLNIPQSYYSSFPLSNGDQKILTLSVCWSSMAVGENGVSMERMGGGKERGLGNL